MLHCLIITIVLLGTIWTTSHSYSDFILPVSLKVCTVVLKVLIDRSKTVAQGHWFETTHVQCDCGG